MIARRQLIRLAAGALVAAAWPRIAHADEGFERLLPLLIDLPGWSATRAIGTTTKTLGATMIMAVRQYRRGKAVLQAQVTITSAVWTWRGMLGRAAARNDPIAVQPTLLKIPLYDTAGIARVTLAADADFMLSFYDLPSAEAIAIARQFDWKAMQAALPA